jgi:hypothetical protein
LPLDGLLRCARNDGFGCLTIESEICAIAHPTRGGGIGLPTEAAKADGALAGVQKDHQGADNPQLCCLQKPRVPLGIPSQCFAISVRIRFA